MEMVATIPVTALRSKFSAGVPRPVANCRMRSSLSRGNSSALVRSSRVPTGPLPPRASAIMSGNRAASCVPCSASGRAKSVSTPPNARKTTRNTTSVASERRYQLTRFCSQFTVG